MIINIKKFGTTLISRPAGKEAYLAFQSSLYDLGETEVLEVDFAGVITLTPSWCDEFVTPLLAKYNKQVKLVNISNASVVETLKILNIFPK